MTPSLRLFHTGDGSRLDGKTLSAEILDRGGVFSCWSFGDENRDNLGGPLCTLDKVGEAVPLEDGVLSRAGWYFLDDSGSPVWNGDRYVCRSGESKDFYLFAYGRDYRKALRALTAVSGSIPLPRRSALGLWYSRYWKFTQEDYLQIIHEFEQNGTPLDNLVLDMDWHRRDGQKGAIKEKDPGWTGWSWNYDLIPNPAELLKLAHARDISVALNSHPHDSIRPHEDMYDEFMHMLGKDPSSGDIVPLDAGSPEYLKAYFDCAHKPHEQIGVDLWWIDWQQRKWMPSTRSVPSLSNLAALNEAYFRHSCSTGRRGTILSRWAGWGDHRHPMHFSGDAYISWDLLRFEVEMTVSSGNAGCVFWSHDIGGFREENDVDDENGNIAKGRQQPELFIRWLQFGAFSAALRLHSGLVEALDKRPWLWGDDVLRGFNEACELRRLLMPYIYSSAYQCSRDSLPLLRPMYLDHPETEEAHQFPGQYYFGDHLLVCPVVSPLEEDGLSGAQEIWLPPGVWVDWFTGNRVEGGQILSSRSKIDEFPLFVRADAAIPVCEEKGLSGMTVYRSEDVSLRIFTGNTQSVSNTDFYYDDGYSDIRQTRDCSIQTVKIDCSEGKMKIRIVPKNRLVFIDKEKTSWRISLIGNRKYSLGALKNCEGIIGEGVCGNTRLQLQNIHPEAGCEVYLHEE
ncbi:MAG: TIM-barrel domain-containing protein [Kiritimatiellales bacterium]